MKNISHVRLPCAAFHHDHVACGLSQNSTGVCLPYSIKTAGLLTCSHHF